jgi:hypothetical protein
MNDRSEHSPGHQQSWVSERGSKLGEGENKLVRLVSKTQACCVKEFSLNIMSKCFHTNVIIGLYMGHLGIPIRTSDFTLVSFSTKSILH